MALLLIAIALLVVPVPMLIGVESCPGCLGDHGAEGLGLCLALLSSSVLILKLLLCRKNRAFVRILSGSLLPDPLLRPPRSALGM